MFRAKNKISLVMALGTLVGCGSKQMGSTTKEDEATQIFSQLTASISCAQPGTEATPAVTIPTGANGEGLIANIQIPKGFQKGSCAVVILGIPRPEYAQRVIWTGSGPNAQNLAYVLPTAPIMASSIPTGAAVVRGRFIKTFSLVPQPGPGGPASPDTGGGPIAPQATTGNAPGGSSKAPIPGRTNAPTDAAQVLQAAGGQNIRIAAYPCSTFSGKSWFTSPQAIYTDDQMGGGRGGLWTCRGDQVWVADCQAGVVKAPTSCKR